MNILLNCNVVASVSQNLILICPSIPNLSLFSYESLTDHYIVDEAKMFNQRYNVLYDVINEYKKQGKVLNDEFMLKIEDVLSEEALSVESSQAKLNAAWHKMSIFDRESSIAQSLHHISWKCCCCPSFL